MTVEGARDWDRRTTNRGDARKAGLINALEELLVEGETLDTIAVADITRRAGVTRSAFYFYFANIATAVAALAERIYDDAALANDILVDISQEPAARIRLAISGLFDAIDRQRHIFRAVLAARAVDPSLREFWEKNRADYAVPIGRLIAAERRAGRAPAGADPHALALMLLELNDRSLELFALGIGPARRKHVDAVVSIWLRSIYGSDPEPASGSSRKEKRR